MKQMPLLLAAILFLAINGSGISYASDNNSFCDQDLFRPQTEPYGYRLRKDRCEGIYSEEIASSPITVVSFTEWFEDYDLAVPRDLVMAWDIPCKEKIRIRARGLGNYIHYRMDTERPVGSSEYRWQSDMLAAMDFSKGDIGVTAWSRCSVGEQQAQQIYLPLRISYEEYPVRTGAYRLLFIPGVEVNEVLISLAKVDTDGRQKSLIRDQKPLEYGYYPAGEPIEVPLLDITTPGIYYLEVRGNLKRGGTSRKEIWFYHAKPTNST